MWNVLLDNSCLIELLASASNIWDRCLGHKSCEHQTLEALFAIKMLVVRQFFHYNKHFDSK